MPAAKVDAVIIVEFFWVSVFVSNILKLNYFSILISF